MGTPARLRGRDGQECPSYLIGGSVALRVPGSVRSLSQQADLKDTLFVDELIRVQIGIFFPGVPDLRHLSLF